MTQKSTIHPLTVVLGAAFTVTLVHSGSLSAADNPFGMKTLSRGYLLLADNKTGEGRCGGGESGKHGEGRCGLSRMDSDGDGKVTKSEFMAGHEKMFEHMDQNADGVIDQAEGDAHMKHMMESMKAGKSSEGKCGGAK